MYSTLHVVHVILHFQFASSLPHIYNGSLIYYVAHIHVHVCMTSHITFASRRITQHSISYTCSILHPLKSFTCIS